MKIELTSDITGQKYTGETYEAALENLQKAEKEFAEAKQLEEEKNKALTVEKKNLCKEIEDCKAAITQARDARKELENSIQKEYDKLIKNYSESYKKLKEDEINARRAYINKLQEYEDKYSRSYTLKLSGEDARKEFNRYMEEFNSIWNSFFRFPF